MNRFADELASTLLELGYSARTVSVDHLPLLKKQIDEQRNQGLLDDQFYQERLAWVRFEVPNNLQNAQSIITIAVPRPQTRAVFTLNGNRHPLIIPPTYTAYNIIAQRVEDLFGRELGKKGHKVARTALPLKLLAARSGLVQYGRNNISYVPGMGSFLELVGLYSDMPCEVDDWQEATMMKNCEGCELCRLACPTGAIPSDRFLLRAERCISYHNEKKGDVPFPAWLAVSWHNSLEGCMRCQWSCPVDKPFIGWVGEEEEFSEEETSLLLAGASADNLTKETIKKLKRLDILTDLSILPRNLGVFFRKNE
jgi:epoxyqueuosine reductase